MFSDFLEETMEVYRDDMLVKSLCTTNYIQHLRQAFDVFNSYQMKLNPEKCILRVSPKQFLRYLVTQKGIEAHLGQIKAILSIPHHITIKYIQRLIR